MTLWSLAKSTIAHVHVATGMGYFRQKDYANAVLSFKKAIDAGDKTHAPECLMRVGMAYETGDGVGKNEADAVQCYMQAALADFSPAILAMGVKLRHGCAAGQSRDGARQMFQKLAERGTYTDQPFELTLEAHRNLQEMDEEDEKADIDREVLKRLPYLADLEKGLEYLNAGEFPKAFAAYKRAADAGSLVAMLGIGMLYQHDRLDFDGRTENAHLQRAAFWFGKTLDIARQTQDAGLAQKARQFLAELDQWKGEQGPQDGHGRTGAGTGTMSRAQALEILDLREDADKAQMKAAWIRLMRQNHPDAGGGNFFAKQLNQVREILKF